MYTHHILSVKVTMTVLFIRMATEHFLKFIHTKKKGRDYYYSHFMGNNLEMMEKFRDHPAGQGTEQ